MREKDRGIIISQRGAKASSLAFHTIMGAISDLLSGNTLLSPQFLSLESVGNSAVRIRFAGKKCFEKHTGAKVLRYSEICVGIQTAV